MKSYQERTYRSLVAKEKLESFRVVVKETDLLVRTKQRLEKETRDFILKHRLPLERYAQGHPEFVDSLVPIPTDRRAPPIVRTMIEAGQKAGVGPMAAVAGAVAEYVGMDLLDHSEDVMVENGGDVFIKTTFSVTVAIFAGCSPLSGRVGIRIDGRDTPMGVCTSSGTIGHSLSMGRADAVVVISRSTALADAGATSIGNAVSGKNDVASAISFGKNLDGVLGIVVVVGDKLGTWGALELVKV